LRIAKRVADGELSKEEALAMLEVAAEPRP
jgi:hypothetical protein